MDERDKYHFDYIIIGNGLAGLQLALKFSSDPYFSNKKFALIDPSPKNTNDKTWCFWEKGNGHWDEIVNKTWSILKFIGPTKQLSHDLEPYSYKMIRSIDFYSYAKKVLKQTSNFKFFLDEAIEVEESDRVVNLRAKLSNYTAGHVFDSRIPTEYFLDKKATKLIQHFKGWVIETDNPIFNPDEFTVMDYRNSFPNSTSFFYILPFTPNKALVEFTFFNEKLIRESKYDEYLQHYINKILEIEEFQILEIEEGQIPMTDFNFSGFNSENITKIGTGGGWVKGSTGYSFKLTENKVQRIIDNLKSGLSPTKGLYNPKYQFYDSIFLRVLSSRNAEGPLIFEKFYDKNKPEDYLAFLNESSSLRQDLKIMHSLFSTKFIKALFHKFWG